jgi:hypothetical protein
MALLLMRRRMVAANGLISFSNGFFFPGFVLFLSSSVERHGMGFDALRTGVAVKQVKSK